MDHCWNKAFYGAETWALQKVDKKYLGSFEMSCWRRMEKISWADRLSNEVLTYSQGGEKTVHTAQRRKDTRTCYILRRNCLLKHFVEGRMEG